MAETWFGLLGPLMVSAGGSPVPVRGRRQRELLTVLLLRANRLVPVELLVDVLWPEQPPASAQRQVQNAVGRLRRTLADGGIRPGVIETQPGGYVLRAGDDELDTLAFDRHVTVARHLAADRPDEAVAGLRAALQLWRGPPIADVNLDLAEREAWVLDDQRFGVVEECAELELRLERYDEVATELLPLVREHPLRERSCALVMVALHRAGRKAEALAVFQHVRSRFMAELCTEPGAELKALNETIRRGDPQVGFSGQPRVRPRQLPADTGDFVGRAGVVAELESLLRRGRAGTAVVVAAIAGPAGVGKTTLAIHVAHRLIGLFPDGQLYVNLMGDGQQARVAPAEGLARFLRALGVAGPAIPDGLDERAEMYRSLLGNRRVLVVLDNAVDEPQVRPLLPGNSGCAVLITRRSPMAGLPGAQLFVLDVLEYAPAAELLTNIVGPRRIGSDTNATRELARLCGRLPLALRIAGARLVAQPELTAAVLADRLADESARLTELTYGDLEVRASLSVSYQALNPVAQRLLRLLSLLDAPDVDSWVCAALLDMPTADTADVIGCLTNAQLLEPLHRNGMSRPRYRLHDLVRLYGREQAEPAASATAAITRALAGLLALVRRAHIAVSGGDFVSVHGHSVLWMPVADELASRVDTDPLGWYEVERLSIVAGVRQAAKHGLHELCWDLAVGTYTLFLTRGHYDDWTETHTTALTATREHGNRRGEGAVLLGFGSLEAYRRNYVRAAELLEESVAAFREIDDPRALSYALGTAAHVDGMRGRYDQAVVRHQKSIAMHREVGDPLAEVLGLRALGKLLVDMHRLAQAEPVLERAAAMSRRRDRRAHAEVLYTIGQLQLARGETAQAEQTFHDVLALADQIGDPRGAVSARYGLGLVRLDTGHLAAAEALLLEALMRNQKLGAVLTEGRIRLSLGEMHRRRGEPDQARHHLAEAVRIFTASQTPLWLARALDATGDLHCGLDEHTAARVLWEQARDLLVEAGLPELVRHHDS